jgi:hypothetical protein
MEVRQGEKEMKERVTWEWSIEHVDEHGDIVHVDFSDKLDKYFASQQTHSDAVVTVIVAVRYLGEDDDGERGRDYYYPDEKDFARVPKKMRAEYARL